MGKILFFLLLGVVAAFGSGTEDMLSSLNDSGGMAGGAIGIGAIHAIFWMPILLFFATAGGVIFFYIKQFKQKDDGLGKTIIAGIVGVIIAVLVFVSSLKLVDGVFDSEGCGKDIVRAYLKDSVQKGFNPSSVFGTNIKAVSCISS